MSDEMVGLLALAGMCLIPFLPVLLWGPVGALGIFMAYRKRFPRRAAAVEELRPAKEASGEQRLRYERLAPTRDLMLGWAQTVMVKPLGGELEAQFKALLDRALSEDFFNRFGDSFVILMRVSCIQVVQPEKEAVQEIWNALIKRHIDFLICNRWTLEPVMAFLIWTGEGNPPESGASPEYIETWRAQGNLRTQEWEQWIATAMLMSGGIPTLLVSRDQVEIFFDRPEILLDTIEPALATHLERAAVREGAEA